MVSWDKACSVDICAEAAGWSGVYQDILHQDQAVSAG